MDYSILVMSDDSYSFLWNQYVDFFYKAWPDCDKKLYICSRTKKYDGEHKNIVSITAGNESSWSKRLIYAIESIETDYIMLSLDDFYLEQEVNVPIIEQAESIISSDEKIAAVYLWPKKTKKGENQYFDNFRIMNNFEPYVVNVQMGLWRKSALKELIREHETPWEFESYGSKRARKSPYIFIEWNGQGSCAFYYDWGKLVRNHMWDYNQVKKLENIWHKRIDLCGIETYEEYGPVRSYNPFVIAKKIKRKLYQELFHSKWKV